MLRHLLELRAGTSVIGIRVDRDAATRGKDTCHLDILRIHQMNEVFHYDIHAILVEGTMIAEAEQVEFQTLALYHLDIRDIANTDFRKVRLPRNGTEAGKFRAIETYCRDACYQMPPILQGHSPDGILSFSLKGRVGLSILS